jgi:glutathione synthase/RimK-type ligase-like ATP-grasp enzyme
MILLCGIPSETPLRMVTDRLDDRNADYILLNQRNFADCSINFEVAAGIVTGELRIGDATHKLEDFRAAYSRLMDDRCLPELAGEPENSPLRIRCRAFHDTLIRWLEISSARVVNRCGPMASNGSKPYQIQLIRDQGFLVPETLVTNDPELVREFRSRHGRIIYKSISSVRSIVQTMEDADDERLENLRWCPAQFQAFVEGTNIRVHTVGGEVFATAACTDATDYRYASRQTGESADLREAELDPDLAERCINLSKSLGLDFAGIDLKVTPDDEVYCFEVNPCPAFSYYEGNAGQPISDGLAKYLMAA